MKWNILKTVAVAALLSHWLAGSVQANAQPRIIGGSNVDISSFPSTVAILQNSRLNRAEPEFNALMCGGTLISSTWVLTAAHCMARPDGIFLPSEISILAGTTDLRAPSTTRTAVSKIIVHADYQQVTFGDDIALLQLAEPAPAPGIDMNEAPLPANQNTYVVGWGTRVNIREDGTGNYPGILQGAVVPTQSTSVCATLSGHYQFVNSDTQICAGFAQGGVDSCQGDSGGPLYNVTKGGNLRLAGITSWGEGCGFANRPGIYTDVAAYKDWIFENMGNNAATPAIASNDVAPNDVVPDEQQNALGIRSSGGGGGGGSLLLIPFLLLFSRFRAGLSSTPKNTTNN